MGKMEIGEFQLCVKPVPLPEPSVFSKPIFGSAKIRYIKLQYSEKLLFLKAPERSAVSGTKSMELELSVSLCSPTVILAQEESSRVCC